MVTAPEVATEPRHIREEVGGEAAGRRASCSLASSWGGAEHQGSLRHGCSQRPLIPEWVPPQSPYFNEAFLSLPKIS